jgi:hypothetical protein
MAASGSSNPASHAIRRSQSLISPETAGARLVARHHRPIMFALSMSDRAQQPIPPYVAAWRGNADGFGSGKNETRILKSHHDAMACRQVPFFGNHFTVGLIRRACEHPVSQHAVEDFGGHAIFAHQRKAFAHGLDSATDDKVIGEFDRGADATSEPASMTRPAIAVNSG